MVGKIVLAVCLFFALITYSVSNARALILFSDNFDDGDSIGWLVEGNPGWHVENGMYGIFLNPGLSNTFPEVWDSTLTSLRYEVDLLGKQGEDRNILVKFKDPSNFLEIHANSSGIYLDKASTEGGAGVQAFTPITLSNNIVYRFKIEVVDNINIKVFLNESLIMSVNESLPLITNWKPGLRAGTGGTPVTEVWFDNIEISTIEASTPSPSPTPMPSSDPSPSPTPTATVLGRFELPFNYPGRLEGNPEQFKSAFWSKMTATFDHAFQSSIHRPFTGEVFSPSNSVDCNVGTGCYDSHNGIDFQADNDQRVYSVAVGYVVFSSSHDDSSCLPETTYGCVVIVRHPGNHYGLYAHLDKINVSLGDSLNQDTLIGEMGETGCLGCGEHLHFGLLKPGPGKKNSVLTAFMTSSSWKEILNMASPGPQKVSQPYCSYAAPNGARFYFQDPSGWMSVEKDPWSLPVKKGGCGIKSPYLWKYDVGQGEDF